MAGKFKIGDLVWAKLKGFPAWPGKVIQPKAEVKRPANKKNSQFVFFFGSENYAWIPEDSVWLYSLNRDKFNLTQRVPKGFKEAVEAIEDALKAMPEELRTSDLPSIDEELELISPINKGKDYSGRKKKKDTEKSKAATKKGKREAVARGVSAQKTDSSPKVERQRSRDKGKKVEQIAEKLSGTSRSVSDNVFTALRNLRPDLDFDSDAANGHKSESDLFADEDSDQGSDAESDKLSMKEDDVKPEKKDPIPKPVKRSIPTVAVPPAAKKQKMLDDSPIMNTAHISPETTKTPIKLPTLSAISSPLKGSPLKPEEVFSGPAPAKDIIPTPAKIGFLGLGIMGQGMVLNLMKSGHEVTVWNRTAIKCRDFVKEGALKGNTPAEVVNQCDITFSCVSDPSALKDLVFGNCGVLQGIAKNKGFVSMSTIDVETATDINEAVTARGGRFLEAPILGSKDPALSGELVILAAGDRTLYSDCFSCFQAIGKKTLYFGNGEVGIAAKMKIITNMLMGTVLAGLSESLALAEKVGLDQGEMLQVIEWSSMACPLISDKGHAIITSNYNQVSHSIKLLQKDLRLAVNMADAVDQAMHVGAAANELFKKAKGKGYGENDVAAVYRAADM